MAIKPSAGRRPAFVRSRVSTVFSRACLSMISNDIRSIVNATVSSRLCVLTGGAFIVHVPISSYRDVLFFILTVQRSRSCVLLIEGGKEKSEAEVK